MDPTAATTMPHPSRNRPRGSKRWYNNLIAPHRERRIFMGLLALCIVAGLLYTVSLSFDLPKTSPKMDAGLQISGTSFTLRGKDFVIKSGSMHYFRMPRQMWDDRLRKARYLGLNTIVTYIPWNLHEPKPGVFDFEDDLDIKSFIELAQVYGLYVILRPGPYICTEWDLGGLPSWLLHDKKMRLRSTYKPFLNAVDRYFDQLFKVVAPTQFSKGGPVIAWQVENEYGSYGDDVQYMEYIKQAFVSRSVTELLFVCDNLGGLGKYKLEGVLQTINFKHDVEKHHTALQKIQPNKPFFVTEFWVGWFDHWDEKHHISDATVMSKILKEIIDLQGSFCFYMLFGGTNFGFMNGANMENGQYKPTITSYDYDSPISETGMLTDKFKMFRSTLRHGQDEKESNDWFPDKVGFASYGEVEMTEVMTMDDLLSHVKGVTLEDVVPMEMLDLDHGVGQSYGYILYETVLPVGPETVKITMARDYTIVMVDGKVVHVEENWKDAIKIKLSDEQKKGKVLRILVENCGRVNYGKTIDNERKGILGHVEINGKKQTGWKIHPIEFKKDFIDIITSKPVSKNAVARTTSVDGPTVYRGTLFIHSRAPTSTFLNMKGWEKGVVFINGRNLGRYSSKGPQQTLFMPYPWLVSGENTIIVFEQRDSPKDLRVRSVEKQSLGIDVIDTEISMETLQGS